MNALFSDIEFLGSDRKWIDSRPSTDVSAAAANVPDELADRGRHQHPHFLLLVAGASRAHQLRPFDRHDGVGSGREGGSGADPGALAHPHHAAAQLRTTHNTWVDVFSTTQNVNYHAIAMHKSTTKVEHLM